MHELAHRGIQPGQHVALYARNGIEHVVGLLAILKIRAVSINVNYRYVESELDYLLGNADVVAVLHERCYAPLVARCAARHPALHTFVALPDVTDPACDADVTASNAVAGGNSSSNSAMRRRPASRSR